jgi:predicted nucleotidyltransferase
MKEKDYVIAKTLKERISGLTRIRDFKVFGSRAREDGDDYSDMDVYIEVENLDESLKRKIRDVAWEVGFEGSIYISIMIFTSHEIHNTPLKASPLVENIERQGIPI